MLQRYTWKFHLAINATTQISWIFSDTQKWTQGALPKILGILFRVLFDLNPSMKFISGWESHKFKIILRFLKSFFTKKKKTMQQIGPSAFPQLNDFVLELAELRKQKLQNQARFALDDALGSVISVIGAEKFLQLIPLVMDTRYAATTRSNLIQSNLLENFFLIIFFFPLNFEWSDESNHSWLLPLLKKSIKNTQIGFFATHFAPLAEDLRQKSKRAKEEHREFEAKNYE